MKISAFTFIKNGEILGYPFIESISSVLPICDEFVVNIGTSDDDTLEQINAIDSPKIKIIQSTWNDNMRNKGFVYGQQKMIAQYSCTGNWAFYVEGDEVYNECDLLKIKQAMQDNLDNDEVEALVMDYYHFYGNTNTYLDSPGWYRSEARIIKNNIRCYAPDGLFWLVLDKNKKGRYPKAKKIGAYCYHYGWVRNEAKMQLKNKMVEKYWDKINPEINYAQMDRRILKYFNGSHPKIMQNWLSKDKKLFTVDSNYKPSSKQNRHFAMLKLEKLLGLELSKKHFSLLKD